MPHEGSHNSVAPLVVVAGVLVAVYLAVTWYLDDRERKRKAAASTPSGPPCADDLLTKGITIACTAAAVRYGGPAGMSAMQPCCTLSGPIADILKGAANGAVQILDTVGKGVTIGTQAVADVSGAVVGDIVGIVKLPGELVDSLFGGENDPAAVYKVLHGLTPDCQWLADAGCYAIPPEEPTKGLASGCKYSSGQPAREWIQQHYPQCIAPDPANKPMPTVTAPPPPPPPPEDCAGIWTEGRCWTPAEFGAAHPPPPPPPPGAAPLSELYGRGHF